MKNLLITGGFGFIGFNFMEFMKSKRPECRLFCIDSLTYAGRIWYEKKLKWCEENNVECLFASILEREKVEDFIVKNRIDTIVNFAAESHVDNSISGPEIFYSTNIQGVTTLLEIVRKFNLRFHQIGTDEVYGSVNPNVDNVDENFPLHTSSPYSASKAAADLITLAYYTTYKCNVTVSRCSNNFGPWQHPEKLIPKVITHALENKVLPLYGGGWQHRFWIHVNDHNQAVLKILDHGKPGNIYNIAPVADNLKSNIDVVYYIFNYLKADKNLIDVSTDRPGHDACYFLIGKKIMEECFFQPKFASEFETDLIDTIEWYKANKDSI